MIPLEIEKLASVVVDASLVVHRELGPGLLESVYEECLALELQSRGLRVQRQVPVSLSFRGQKIDVALRADMVIEGKLLIELKAVEALLPVHKAQVITYLKLINQPLGLLINFNVPLIKDGIHRVLRSKAPIL